MNAYFESIFEVGVDEMLWDDMHKNDMVWPTVSEVHEYRKDVYDAVVDAILTHPSLDDGGSGKGVVVHQDHPMWALFIRTQAHPPGDELGALPRNADRIGAKARELAGAAPQRVRDHVEVESSGGGRRLSSQRNDF